MTDSKHTPGPWIWADGYNGLYGAGPNSDVLTYAMYEGMWLSYNNEDANAALIAAAPDMLTALKNVISALDGRVHSQPALGTLHAAREAIAKAET